MIDLVKSSFLFSLVATLGLLVGLDGIAQNRGMVVMKGKVLDARSDSPLPSEITYKKLPYGSITGKKSFNDQGNYQFQLPRSDTFEITVNASSYQPISINVVPRKEAKNGVIEKNFTLFHRPEPGELLQLQNKIYFGRGAYNLNKDSKKAVDEILNIMQRTPGLRIRLEGHTDYRGSEDLLMRLSRNRINSIKNYLVNHGIDDDRIKTKAFGGTRPLERGNSREARQKNRRVEIRVLER